MILSLMKGLKEKYNKKNIIFHGWVNKIKFIKIQI